MRWADDGGVDIVRQSKNELGASMNAAGNWKCRADESRLLAVSALLWSRTLAHLLSTTVPPAALFVCDGSIVETNTTAASHDTRQSYVYNAAAAHRIVGNLTLVSTAAATDCDIASTVKNLSKKALSQSTSPAPSRLARLRQTPLVALQTV